MTTSYGSARSRLKLSQLSDLVHVLLDELSQYRSVEQEEKLLNELENEDI